MRFQMHEVSIVVNLHLLARLNDDLRQTGVMKTVFEVLTKRELDFSLVVHLAGDIDL
jgi:hypothetical protein